MTAGGPTLARVPLVLTTGLMGLVALGVSHLDGGPSYPIFCVSVVALLLAAWPRHAFAPTTFVFLYYFLWYVIPPGFADRFEGADLSAGEYTLSFLMSFAVLVVAVLSSIWGEYRGARGARRLGSPRPLAPHAVQKAIVALFAIATSMVLLIVFNSGGLSVWIANPGDAFLNRAGTGVYVVLSHFSSLLLAALCGYFAYTQRRRWPLVAFVAWLFVTSPVHGSKAQMTFLLVMLFLPWMREVRTLSARSVVVLVCALSFFVMGLYFRNVEWMDAASLIPYALNYFSTFEYLALSVRDFEPDFMFTFFLPFQKFLTPFGIDYGIEYYDMNHLLTDIYYPSAWEIRATEQWPVETDLYLNFFFVGGLPLIVVFMFTVAWLRGVARSIDSLGAWFASGMMTLLIISHFRGSIINHTDFYMYPYLFTVYMVLRRVPLRVSGEPASSPASRTSPKTPASSASTEPGPVGPAGTSSAGVSGTRSRLPAMK